jgi:hypothetical protein
MAEAEAMSGAEGGNAEGGAVAKPEPPAPGQDISALLKRASKGDESCLPEVRALLADGKVGREWLEGYGSSAEWLRQSIIGKAANGHVLAQEAIGQKLDAVRAELEGPGPTPMERLLAERASLCWFIVNWCEDSFIENIGGMSISQANFHLGRIDKAHARFLSAVKTLAQVRKLALPTLQLNIARNQVNVAEVRS